MVAGDCAGDGEGVMGNGTQMMQITQISAAGTSRMNKIVVPLYNPNIPSVCKIDQIAVL